MSQSQTIITGVIVFVIAILMLIILGILPGLKPSRPAPFSIELWGIRDEENIWRTIIKPFQEVNSHITVHYTRFPEETYESTLVERLAENTGPDVFMLENSRLIQHREKLYPLPQQALRISINNFTEAFVDIAASDLIGQDGNIYGMPLYTDSLALFYNKDLFNIAGIAKPPQNWDELATISRKLTQISPAGDVAKSGIALGSGKNIEYAFEIISAMILQNGDPIINRAKNMITMEKPSQDALAFYASFADRTKQNFTWSNLLPRAQDAFAEEKTAMIFGFSNDIARIKAKNSHINMGVAPFIQLSDTQKPSAYGRYVFLTVSKLSKHPVDAWNFIAFATNNAQASTYTDLTDLAPARRDVLTIKAPPLESEVFWRQSLIAKSWPVPDYQKTKILFEDAVESISTRSATFPQAFNQLKEQLRLLLP
ncbi:MAG: extracellular solute-binding protein [Candidatus Sungbacteria bacterium]|nr:extracellular solute-binding protein [Candidatus Sungbacteria bacterium]